MATRDGKYQVFLDGNKKTSIGANEGKEVYIQADALRLPISVTSTTIETVNGQIRFNSERQKFQIYLNEWLDLATSQEVAEITTEDLGLGWARYDDTVYNSGFKFTVDDGEDVVLPNNAGNIVDTHLHSTIQYYDGATQKIQTEHNADVYIVTIVFKASAPNANQTYINLKMEQAGPTPYERLHGTLVFPKGNDVAHDFHEVFQYYTDDDFLLNGAQWKLQPIGGPIDVWDIIYFVQRTQSHQMG